MVWAASEPSVEYSAPRPAWAETMITSALSPISATHSATASASGSKVSWSTPCLVPSHRGMLGVSTPMMATFTPPRSTMV